MFLYSDTFLVLWTEQMWTHFYIFSTSTSDNEDIAFFSLNVSMFNISTLFQLSVLTSIFTSLNVFAQFGPKHKVRMLSWQDMSKTFFGKWLLCPLKQLDSFAFSSPNKFVWLVVLALDCYCLTIAGNSRSSIMIQPNPFWLIPFFKIVLVSRFKSIWNFICSCHFFEREMWHSGQAAYFTPSCILVARNIHKLLKTYTKHLNYHPHKMVIHIGLPLYN